MKTDDQYSKAESAKRYKAALQGAFKAPSKPLKSLQAAKPKKRPKPVPK